MMSLILLFHVDAVIWQIKQIEVEVDQAVVFMFLSPMAPSLIFRPAGQSCLQLELRKRNMLGQKYFKGEGK